MADAKRYLTKSRFKVAAECPTKLSYAGNPNYLDRSVDDTFLVALAEGGYQVGELARLMHPGGVLVDVLDHAAALARTEELLKRGEVTIFEAALAFEDLFIRIDIIKKRGDQLELIEVKAKSYSAQEDGDFRNAKGRLKSEFVPYLRDVAFQRYVAERALPGLRVRALLMLVDKSSRTSVDGLNQRFRARRDGGRLRIDVAPGTDATTIGTPVLTMIGVDGAVDEILAGTLAVGPDQAMPFAEAVQHLGRAYAENRRIAPMPSAECGRCQFKANRWPTEGEPKSGFHECWSTAFNWTVDDFAHGTVLDLWSFAGKSKLIDQGVLKPSQVTAEDLGFDGQPPGLAGLTRKHRQWYYCQPDWPNGGEFYIDKDGMQRSIGAWTFPLHFVDFETCAVAIPFVKNRRPYETTAFQFSHHVMDGAGRVSHRTQWLCVEPGRDPNTDFLRALKAALLVEEGTIFRWAAHENTVLNQLRERLLTQDEPPTDQADLVAFIECITARTAYGQSTTGPRSMVDLCALAEKLYFDPFTKGSTSLKKVLPALMRRSESLRNHYSAATYGGPGVSLNFEQPVAWWQMRDGEVLDPYLLLPPVFDDVSQQEMEAIDEGLSEELREGGAAMVAYARLQFEDLPTQRREAMRAALLRYCELDTLAMVMAVQAWSDWAKA